jgi:hypothetical protein
MNNTARQSSTAKRIFTGRADELSRSGSQRGSDSLPIEVSLHCRRTGQAKAVCGYAGQ